MLEAVHSAMKGPAGFEPDESLQAELENEPRRPLVLVAACPKSASTFVGTAVAIALDLKPAKFCESFVHAEQEPSPYQIARFLRSGGVSRLHCRATGPGVKTLNFFGVKTIVLARRPEDVMVSLHDELIDPIYAFSENHFSFARTNGDFMNLPPAGRRDFLIRFALPWLIQFRVSWNHAIQTGKINSALVVKFEDLALDPLQTLENTLQFVTGNPPDHHQTDRLKRVIAGKNEIAQWNIGEIGRGMNWFTPNELAEIRKVSSYYPEHPI